ncbi:FIST C-terminal domain-containing protein [Patescibacteria group bacterium]|nr:FIST C-terminal domain-containing protein [Patescibacteria group bacterium]
MKIEQKIYNPKDGWVVVSDNKLNSKAQLVFVFGATDLLKKDKHFKEIKKFYPKAHILSASTSGEILGNTVTDNTIVVTAINFEHTKLKVAQASTKSMQKSFDVGAGLAKKLPPKDLVHAIIISDGLGVNGTELVKGISSKLPKNVAVTGGLAGDGARFQETVVGLDIAPKKNIIAIIGFYGKKLKVGYGSMGGWDSFGPERLITKSKGNVLYELDGKPALKLYKEYLGKQARDLPASGLLFPLSIRTEKGEENIVRTILAVDEKNQSLTFAGDVPEGSYGRLMKANFDRLVEGSSGAAKLTNETSKNPEFALLISCVGRKLVLKQRTDEEIESAKEQLGKQVAITGFYSYGEICPIKPTVTKCELHNQTMTITTFKEK